MDAITPIYVIRANLTRTNPNVEPPSYHLGQPLLGVADSLIARMMIVDGAVEVFARKPSNPKKGYRFSLCAPTVATVVAACPASPAALTKFLADVQSDESITEVNDIEGFAWKLNEPPSGYPDMTIVKMIYSGDTVDVIATPNSGSPLESQVAFLLFTLMPMSFVRVCTEAPLDVWIEMQTELEEMLADDGDDDDDEEEDEIEEQVAAAVATAPPKLMVVPPPPALLNGTPAVPEAPPQPQPPNQE
jgi:hypothetical protein